MAFQLDSNIYSKQKTLSDYMAVKDARDLQRAQAERSIEASDMAIDAAKQKQVKDKIGLILAQTTPENYAESKAAIEAEGFPIKLPDSFEASKPIRDAILTATGYKAKPSLAEQLMQPFSMMMGVQQPQEPAPTQAASIAPQGSIKTNEVPQMDTNGQPMPQLNDILKEPIVAGIPNPPAINPPEPTSVPVPQPLPTLQTPVPAPYQPKTVGGAFEADKAAAKASAEAMAPMSEKQRAEIAIKQAPIEEAKKSKQRAQSGFDSIMEDMNQVYDDLASVDAAPSESKSWDENLGIWVTKTNPVAQAIGGLTGTKAQSIIQRLDPLKTRAKEQIMMATGMSSKAIDSNAEMKSFLDSLTNVNNTREANAFTIQTMQRLYGTPEKAAARDAAIKSGQIQPITDFSGQGGSTVNTSGSSGGGAPMQIKGADDYNALPKGTVYIDPNGKQRTKQ